MKKNHVIITSIVILISIFIFSPASESRCAHFSNSVLNNSLSTGFFANYSDFSKLNPNYDIDTDKESGDYFFLYTKTENHRIKQLIQYFIPQTIFPLFTILSILSIFSEIALSLSLIFMSKPFAVFSIFS